VLRGLVVGSPSEIRTCGVDANQATVRQCCAPIQQLRVDHFVADGVADRPAVEWISSLGATDRNPRVRAVSLCPISKAIVRSRLWDSEAKVPRAVLPSIGTILAPLNKSEFDGKTYDREAPKRIREQLY
jgi:hypothetical protein